MELKKASRKQVKIRMSVAAPTGFGKTIAALLIAYGITKNWETIAVIDTENESASLYADHTIKKTGFHIGEFNTIALAPPFSAEKYTDAIKICENAGMEVIIIDSVTHVWNGEGGLLEDNNKLGGKYQDWAKTTPRYQKWLNSILHSSAHIITTNRKKQGYSMITENGRTKVEKVGMEDQIRDGYDYEMTIAFEVVNNQHLCVAGKDRTGLFTGIPEFVINEDTGRLIKEWCESGKAEVGIDYEKTLRDCETLDQLKHAFLALPKDKQIQFEAVKNEIKANLTPKPEDLPIMGGLEFEGMILGLKNGTKEAAMKYLKDTRTKFSFNTDQETIINDTIVTLTSKKAA